MKSALIFSILLLSFNAFSVDMKNVKCWKGFSQVEQDKNLTSCTSEKGELQKCSDNMWVHGKAAYDVCLMQASKPKKVLTIYRGWSQKDQNRNIKMCLEQETANSICVDNAWTHGQAAYDVCLME